MTEKTVSVTLRLVSDASGLKAGAGEAKAAIKEIADGASQASTATKDLATNSAAASDELKRVAGSGKQAAEGVKQVGTETQNSTTRTSAFAAAFDRMADRSKAATVELGASATASRTMASAQDVAATASRSLGEAQGQVGDRISEMVRASIAAKEAIDAAAAARNAEKEALRESTRAIEVDSTARAASRAQIDALTHSASSFLAESKKLDGLLASEATTLGEVTERRNAYAKALENGLLTESEHADALKNLDRNEKAVAASMAKSASELERLIGKYDPADAALRKLAEDEKRLTSARDAGTISQQKYERAMAGLTVQRARWHSESEGIKETSNALGKLSLSSRDAISSYAYLGRYIATGDWRGASQAILSVGNSTGVLRAGLLGVGAAVGLAVGTIATLGVAAYKGSQEQYELERAVIATGGAAGKTAGQLLQIGDALGRTTGQYGNARSVVLALAQSGKIAGDQLERAGILAINFATVTGRSIDDAVASITKLSTEPVRAIKELDAQYNVINLQTYERIKALEREGRETEAAALANQTFSAEFANRATELRNNLGLIDSALLTSKNLWDEFWDAAKGVGRAATAQDEVDRLSVVILGQRDLLDGLKAEQAKPEGFLKDLVAGTVSRRIEDVQSNLTRLYDNLAKAQDKVLTEGAAAAAKAVTERIQAEGKAASDRIDTLTNSLDKNRAAQERVNKAAADLYKIHKAGGQLPEGISFSGPLADVPVGPGWDKLQAKLTENKQAARDLAKQQRDLARDQREVERASNAQEIALGRLADITDTLGGKLDPVDKAWADYNKTLRDIDAAAEKAIEAQAKLGDAGVGLIAITEKKTAAENAAVAARERSLANIARDRDVTGRTLKDLATETRLIGLSTAAQRAETIVQRALADAKEQNLAAGKEIIKVDEARIRQQATLNEALSIAASVNQKSPFEQMIEDAQTLGDTLRKAIQSGFDPIFLKPMQDALGKLNKQIRGPTVGAFLDLGQAVVGSMKNSAEEGSRHYAALEVAQAALALGQGINAILTQGQGDPYTAFPRMAAMAAIVIPLAAQLGASIKNFGASGYSDTAAQRQASQGTGSVLGDANAKSETIANSVEISANAAQQLVAISRGMLNALNTLVAGLGSAAVMLARGAGTADFSGQNLAVGNSTFFSNSINDPFGFFGGSSKVTDEGIIIFGGALTDMLNSIAVGAYQEVQSRSWAFGSTHTNEGFSAVSDEFANQFQLIVGSIIDTVREGATAIGLLPADIQARLDAFAIETTRISLKGLSAEEAQAELQAVFSKMFDGLAGSVVPFIAQFQRVGEGLGETLVRVATGVQVTQEAIRYLGLTVDETDPERFAQLSEGLIDAVGGIDKLISGMQNFVANFATDADRLQVATDSINAAFEQAGLTVPATSDAMWALMRSLDATTEQGREQIATLLRLSDTAAEYYQLLDKAEKAHFDYIVKVSDLQTELGIGGGFVAASAQITDWTSSTIKALNSLAQSAGRMGASERDLQLVRDVAQQRLEQLIAKLKEEATALAVQLGYRDGVDTLDSLNAAIDALTGSSSNAAQGISSAVDTIRNQISLLLGDLSPYNDRQKLEIARQGLQNGTVTQEQFLEIARRLFGATNRYLQEFLFAQRFPGQANPTGNGSASTTTTQSADSRSLAELLAARDALLEQQQAETARTLASRIAELSLATESSFADVATSLGFDLSQLGTDLGLDSERLNAYLESLRAQFEAQNFAVVGDLITQAIDNSRDAIVAAIQGDPVPAIPNGNALPADASNGVQAVFYPAKNTVPANGGDAASQLADLTNEMKAARQLLSEIASATGATATNTEVTNETLQSVAAETADVAEETRSMRRELAGIGGGRVPRSDRGREFVR
jgi:hypothetical protein